MSNLSVLIIDNYDSFTFNLAHLFAATGVPVSVLPHDDSRILSRIETKSVSHVIISPGPGHPQTIGYGRDVLVHHKANIPILGVCLGMQALAYMEGASIEPMSLPRHGKVAMVDHNQEGLFKNLSTPLRVAQYHSLHVLKETLPPSLEITSSWQGIVMGLRHRLYPWVEGVQFHPESFLSEQGTVLAKNFLQSRVTP
jgi:anthranilate synthase/aminodeoxychorismate synthase-like glutamine amidotransferase